MLLIVGLEILKIILPTTCVRLFSTGIICVRFGLCEFRIVISFLIEVP